MKAPEGPIDPGPLSTSQAIEFGAVAGLLELEHQGLRARFELPAVQVQQSTTPTNDEGDDMNPCPHTRTYFTDDGEKCRACHEIVKPIPKEER